MNSIFILCFDDMNYYNDIFHNMGIYFDITNIEQFNSFIENAKCCIVYFHATWCGPCKISSPQLENLAMQNKNIKKMTLQNTQKMITAYDIVDKIVFLKIDIDNKEMKNIIDIFNIQTIPHVVFFGNSGKLQKSYFPGNQCNEIIEYVDNELLI